jgi:N-acetylmuramoyl-L-alanine amidase
VPQHLVNQGECIASIADMSRTTWERIWDHPNNAGLRARRKNPGILYPGDLVFVPQSDTVFGVQTGASHTFTVHREKVQISLRLLDRGEPIAGAAYELAVDGEPYPPGSTDGDGTLKALVPRGAQQATVTFTALDRVIVMKLGVLDPVTETTGLKARLKQLGYYEGDVDTLIDDPTRLALWGFQMQHGLDATGEPDDATRAALEEAYSI